MWQASPTAQYVYRRSADVVVSSIPVPPSHSGLDLSVLSGLDLSVLLCASFPSLVGFQARLKQPAPERLVTGSFII